MQVPTHPLLSLLECTATGLKSLLTHYIDATVDSQFASLRNSFETMIQSGVIGPNCDGTHFGMTLPQPTHTNTHQSSDEWLEECSNDNLTRTQRHQNNLQNEANTINTESMIKQEFDDEEEVGKEIDDDNVTKYENGICTSGEDAEKGENGDESSDKTQLNVHAASENNQINKCFQSSSITSIPLHFANNSALNDISVDEQIEGQNTKFQFDEFDDNDDDYDEDSEEEYLNNPNCEDCANGDCDFDHENNNNPLNHHVSTRDGDETNLDEAQLQIDISVTNNTQMNNQNANTEKCVSERNMEQSTPSTSGGRSSTRKRIQTKVFGDLVQSNGNHGKCGKRKSDQTNESGKKAKRKQIFNYGEDTDDDDQDDQDDQEHHATECTTNPIQPNLSQPNRHLHCSHCHKSFDRNSHLQRHLRVHTGERSFQCDLCDKRFNNRSNLATHQLIHQNIKRFQCKHCDKRFNHKVTFNNHLLLHSGERPHQCRFCEKAFAHLHVRNSHEQAIHLHVKPYGCKQCAHTATHRSQITRHIRVVHFGLPPTIKQQRALNIVDQQDPRELIEKV